jgi:hypothetical protein
MTIRTHVQPRTAGVIAEEAAEIGGPDPEPGVDPAEDEEDADEEDADEEDAGSTFGEADHSGAQGDDS